MIRLTIALLLSVGATLAIAGRDLDHPMGSDGEAVVARAQTDLTDARPGRLALDDEAGAIARALAATNAVMSNAAEASTAPEQPMATAPERPAATAPRAIVNATRVNLRAGPSTSNQVLDQVVANQEVEIIDRTPDGWAEVRVIETGLTAYVFDRFLTPRG